MLWQSCYKHKDKIKTQFRHAGIQKYTCQVLYSEDLWRMCIVKWEKSYRNPRKEGASPTGSREQLREALALW